MVQKTFKDTVASIVNEILQDNVRLSMPAVIVSVAEYPTSQMIDVKPLVNNLYKDRLAVEYPIIFRVPVVLLGGGGALISVPLKIGDIVKLDFSRDSLDEFLQSRGDKPVTPSTFRRYNLTDAIATPALPTNISNLKPNATDLEIKLLDSSGGLNASVKMTPEGNLVVDAKTDLSITIGGAANITIAGDCNLDVSGDCNLDVSGDCNIDASQVNLGSGGNEIARKGDAIKLIIPTGSSAGTWYGVVHTGGNNTST